MLGPLKKRVRSTSEDSDCTQQRTDVHATQAAAELWQGAQVLQALKLARWVQAAGVQECSTGPSEDVDEEHSCSSSTLCETAFSSSNPELAAETTPLQTDLPRSASVCSKVSAASTTTRSYVWRGPARRCAATPPAADPHGTGEGGADYQGGAVAVPSRPAAPCCTLAKADCDKEWAALTTWIRMNLHQPRTQKRVVLFVGCWVEASGRWVFNLNEELTWDDVGAETKLRLRTLPEETAAAFARKYPHKQRNEWQKKSQKYRLPGGRAMSVPLGDMITSLHEVFMRYDAATGNGSPAQ